MVCPASVCKHDQLVVDQILMVWSRLAEASNEPSGAKATAVTLVVCALALVVDDHSWIQDELVLKTQIVLSSHPDAIRPREEKATLVTADALTAVL